MKIKWTDRIPLDVNGVARIKKVAGIYKLLHYDSDKKKYYVHYVGQAKDLNDRLTEHLSVNEVNKCCIKHLNAYNCYFRAAAVSTQVDRDGAEVALYNEYKPSCVERIPDVKPIEINFS